MSVPDGGKPEITRRIGLLGGSFNPAHGGHREISLAALSHLSLDAVWWLVTPGNPLKAPEHYIAYHDRLAQARRVADHADIVVSDFENRRTLQYTVDTLAHIKDANPTAGFVWLMGADSLATFHLWKDWRRIAELTPIAVFNRPGYEDDALNSEAATALSVFRMDESDAAAITSAEPPAWVFISETRNSLSSTEIRNRRNQQTEN
ncbi:MAG: nicotinate-nucleotide adenylyltransferase [Pseudomonadota bacterium]